MPPRQTKHTHNLLLLALILLVVIILSVDQICKYERKAKQAGEQASFQEEHLDSAHQKMRRLEIENQDLKKLARRQEIQVDSLNDVTVEQKLHSLRKEIQLQHGLKALSEERNQLLLKVEEISKKLSLQAANINLLNDRLKDQANLLATLEGIRIKELSRSVALSARQQAESGNLATASLLLMEAYKLRQQSGQVSSSGDLQAILLKLALKQVIPVAHTDNIRQVFWHQGTSGIITGGDDGRIERWQIDTINNSYKLSDELYAGESAIRSLGVAADGKWVFAGTSNGKLLLWNTEDPGIVPMVPKAHSDVVSSIVIDYQRNVFYTGGYDGRVVQWNYDGNEIMSPRAQRDNNRILCMAIHTGLKLLVWSDGQRNITTWSSEGKQPAIAHSEWPVTAMSFTPDGTRLVCGDELGKITVYSFPDMNILSSGSVHISAITQICIHPSKPLAYTCGLDGQVNQISLDTGEVVNIVSGKGWLHSISLVLSGNHLAVPCKQEKIILIPLDEAKTLQALCKQTGRSLKREEWDNFVSPYVPYSPCCDGNKLTEIVIP